VAFRVVGRPRSSIVKLIGQVDHPGVHPLLPDGKIIASFRNLVRPIRGAVPAIMKNAWYRTQSREN
jgi:hypothetical protein